MKTTSLDVTGKLPLGLVQLYQVISRHTSALGIPYLVVGATARDIILHHGFGAAIERGTRDVDFGIQVQSWDQYQQLRSQLLNDGFTPHKFKAHQLVTTLPNEEEWEIDLIPFGGIAGDRHAIAWPPKHEIEMTVTGFKEALDNALNVTIADNPAFKIKVASPAGMLILKLISWLERDPSIRRKDAMDIYYMTKHYSKIPEVLDSLYEDNFMEAQDYDEHKASAMILAHDACRIASPEAVAIINEQLFDNAAKLDNLILDMSRVTNIDYQDISTHISIIKTAFFRK
jgi:predicted nucleotidyltransferase